MAERKACVLDGKALAAETRAQVAAELKSLREKYHDDFQPGLTIVQVVSLQQQFTLINERCCIKAIHLCALSLYAVFCTFLQQRSCNALVGQAPPTFC